MKMSEKTENELPELTFCMGSSCFVRGNEANLEAVLGYLEKHNLKDEVDINLQCCLCRSLCGKGPVIFVNGKECQVENTESAIRLLEEALNMKKSTAFLG
jgi:NADH:ubiquinone oxidoreductase subunit E